MIFAQNYDIVKDMSLIRTYHLHHTNTMLSNNKGQPTQFNRDTRSIFCKTISNVEKLSGVFQM